MGKRVKEGRAHVNGQMCLCNHPLHFILGDNLLYLSNKNIDAQDVTISNRS